MSALYHDRPRPGRAPAGPPTVQRWETYRLGHEVRPAVTRHREFVPAGTQLYIIWKRPDWQGEYQGGLGYAGFLPTDEESARWHAGRVAQRLRNLYWWLQDVELEVLPYKPATT